MKTVPKWQSAGENDAKRANTTMGTQKQPKRAVVAAIMVGDGDFKPKYESAKSLF